MPSTLLQYFSVLLGLIYLQMENFKRDNFKKDIKPLAFCFFLLSNSSKTLNMLRDTMITNYNKSKATLLHVTTVNTRIISWVSICSPPSLCSQWRYDGFEATIGSESTVKQIGRPVDSAATVYEWEGLQARQPGQNKMLHRIIFVPMVELIILLFYSLSDLFSSNGCAVSSLNLWGVCFEVSPP